MRQNIKLKMLFCVTIFCVILGTTWSQDNKIVLYLSPTHVIELRKFAESCGNQYGIDPKELRLIMKGPLQNDQPHKQFLHCIFATAKYVTEDGHYNMEKALTMVPLNGTSQEVKHILEDCNKITKENSLETMYEMSICYHQHFIPTAQKPYAP